MEKITIFIIVISVALGSVTQACNVEDVAFGCGIFNGECQCGWGCKSDYKYPMIDSCRSALKGEKLDPCKSTPCLNNGLCIQVPGASEFKCFCAGTGFYGPNCDRPCFELSDSSSSDTKISWECINI